MPAQPGKTPVDRLGFHHHLARTPAGPEAAEASPEELVTLRCTPMSSSVRVIGR